MPALNEVTHLVITGEMDPEAAKQARTLHFAASILTAQAIDLCLDGCGQLYGMLRNCLLETAKKRAAK